MTHNFKLPQAKRTFNDFHHFAQPVAHVTPVLKAIKPSMHVIDLGCGVGTYFAAIRHRTGPHANITGVDLNKELLKKAVGNARRNGVKLVYGNAENLDCLCTPNSTDFILGIRVLDETSVAKVLTACFKVLKKNGTIVFSIAETSCLLDTLEKGHAQKFKTDLKRIIVKMLPAHYPQYLILPGKVMFVNELQRLLKKTGYKNVQTKRILRKIKVTEIRKRFRMRARLDSLIPNTRQHTQNRIMSTAAHKLFTLPKYRALIIKTPIIYFIAKK